ncbi:MAG TPA: hypothetical protein PKD85_04890 [Saprospiraceae bacterium]|nr:hypothetical protein [Saprospiraceae bacterium]
MKKIFISTLLLSHLIINAQNKWLTPFEKGNGNTTPTYEEIILYYTQLSNAFKTLKIEKMGTTDAGFPIHIITFDALGKFDMSGKTKLHVLINNNIHAGEPDGIDASMMYMRDLAQGKIKGVENVIISCIAVYSVGGTFNRGAYSRANQNGPEMYGFRANARNYDLNRDFIKSDTKNAKTFAKIFHKYYPDVFIDNHVSNGADYQYTLTIIETHPDRLGNQIGSYLRTSFTPNIQKNLLDKGVISIPYVNSFGPTPEKGITQFIDYGRYSTGYASLFHTIGYMPETHMLKPYADRVKVTYDFTVETIKEANKNFQQIKKLKNESHKNYTPGSTYPLTWTVDQSQYDEIEFLGYEASYKPSEVSGKDRLYYDRSKPFVKTIPYYNKLKNSKFTTIPSYYIIPKAQHHVVELLQLNQIKMVPFKKDTILEVEKYKIKSFTTAQNPYEGHYIHSNTEVEKSTTSIKFQKGDFLVPTQQKGVKYLLETLEPEAYDSFFNWNFFDTYLQTKEHFSAYVFEDIAAELLKNDPKLRQDLEAKKAEDQKFAESAAEQLRFIYTRSPYYEKEHMSYPIYRVK